MTCPLVSAAQQEMLPASPLPARRKWGSRLPAPPQRPPRPNFGAAGARGRTHASHGSERPGRHGAGKRGRRGRLAGGRGRHSSRAFQTEGTPGRGARRVQGSLGERVVLHNADPPRARAASPRPCATIQRETCSFHPSSSCHLAACCGNKDECRVQNEQVLIQLQAEAF